MKSRGKAWSLRRRLLQPLLLLATVLVALAFIVTSLQQEPALPNTLRPAACYSQPDFQQTLALVNQQMDTARQAAGVSVSPPAEPLAVARRIALGLVGSGLSLEEVRALEQLPADQQVASWTTYLLQDRRWADYFAERFSRVYVGTQNGPFLLFRRRKLNTWLADQFQRGHGYDEVARELLSAQGLWTDTPQVNFVTATMDEGQQGRSDPIRLAGRTSRAFLAQRIDCLQCHDDYLGQLNFGTVDDPVSGLQEHFHSLAAFFAGTAVAEVPFRGITEDHRPYRYQPLGEGSEQRLAPAVPFAPDLLPSAGSPRSRLAHWVTHPENKAFSRATVNRVWSLMFSRPLVAPVDSIPLDAALPPVLDTLAEDFAAHGFDLRRLIHLIVSSDAFQRQSRADFEISELHEAAWAVFPVTQLRPEQVAGSILQACKLTAIDASSSIFTRLATYFQTRDFLKRFGDRGQEEGESQAVTVTIPQRLVLMNGKLVAERTKSNLVLNASTRIGALVTDDDRAVEAVYLSVFNRRPSASEQQQLTQHLSGKKGKQRQQALRDIYWAMINSTEFSWNH
ncbi:MAG: DUF1553 domain-containing protein [Planctomycetales bacterium]|nr:DUF1553 domain-containing protein [Planctomycetales bacterium]